MNTGRKAKGIIFIALVLVCLPVSAYSAEAVRLYTSGNSLLESENYSGAYAEYTRALSLEPAYYEAWDGIADALNRDGQFGEALAASNRSLEINPGYAAGWINRGQILYNLGYQYEDVAKDIAKADMLYAEQLGAFEKAVSLEPGNAEAWFNKGYALAGMKRYDEALAAFDRVYAIDPAYPNLLKNREIAVQLRNSTAPATTGTAVAASAATPVAGSPQQTVPATRAAPLSPAAALIALAGALPVIIRRL